MAITNSKYPWYIAQDAAALNATAESVMEEEYRRRQMPLSYRRRVFSISRDIHTVHQQLHWPSYYSSATKPYETETRYTEIPPGFARECMLEFVNYGDYRANWFIEKGSAVSVDTYVVMDTYEYRADFIAHMTPEQVDAWEKFEFMNKLAGT